MDLVESAGLDVSAWARFKGGKKKAAPNPKYCYQWAFVEPGRLVLLNLWHASLREKDGIISVSFNHRSKNQRNSKVNQRGVWTSRGRKFDLALQEAVKHQLQIRAIINEGKMRDSHDKNAKASHVQYRLLDPIPWFVGYYNFKTGDSTLIRGPLNGQFVDQFSVAAEPDSTVERRTFSGSTFVRNPAHRTNALARANGKCEYCGQSGFKMSNGKIFLETHHVVPLSENGLDSEYNVVAICANHHREAHHGDQQFKIREWLLNYLEQLKVHTSSI